MTCCCPYCMSELDINEVKYYVKLENEPSQPKLKAFLTVNREDRHFYNFWSRYNRKISPEMLERRIVKSLEEMERERAILASDAEQYAKRANAGNGADDSEEEIRPGQGIDRALRDIQSEHFVLCEISRETRNGRPTQFVIREDGQRIAITYPVCPSCYNRIPEEIFEMPLIKIALAASKSGGKTCMALSWFRTLNDARGRGLNSHVSQMDFVSMLQDQLGMEDDFGKMLRKFVHENICPAGTNKQFIPPIFLKMNWHGRQERQALIGIYDAAGEVITESQRDAELVYYMKYMDGVIYMIEPDRTGLNRGLTNQYLCMRDEDIATYYENAIMLSTEEQSNVQIRNLRRETLAQIMNVRQGDMALLRENSAMEVLTALRSYVEDTQLQHMHVALAISKCDELRSNHEIAEYNRGNLLFMDEEQLDNNQRSMRNIAIQRLFEERIFNMQIFANVFNSCSVHMIAALGCPAEVPDDSDENGEWEESRESRLTGDFNPIRVEEPLLELIFKYAEDHGWNE